MKFATSNDERKSQLQGLLEKTLSPKSDPPTTSCVLAGPVHDGSRSVIFRGDGSLFPYPVAIKQCKTLDAANIRASDDARIQFDALQAVSRAFENQAELTVPRPVELIEDEAIVISEWIDGTPLTQALHDPAKAIAEIERGVIAAGRWLAAFHDYQSLPPQPLDTNWALGLVNGAMDSTSRRFQMRSSVSRARTLLEAMTASVAMVDVPFSWTHGDYKPDNVLIGNERTVGIDVSANFTNAVLYDIAQFLNNLEIAIYHPKGLRLLPHRERLIEAFRWAYGGLDEVAIPETWVRLLSALRLRAELWASGRGLRRTFNDLCAAVLMRRLERTLRQNCA